MKKEIDADVIIIGAGGGGAVAAKELGEKGRKVLVLEAGPWYGNIKWPDPNKDQGAVGSSNSSDLSIGLLKQSFTDLENDMNDSVTGKLRWGPANRDHSPWLRSIAFGGVTWQNAGVGGSTLHYLANSPRAYPQAVNNIWPITYDELIPYYEKVERMLPVYPAPVTAKEELFYDGAKKAGWKYIDAPDVISPGYRPQPNAILKVNPQLSNADFNIKNNKSVGCTLRGHCVNGCHIGPTIEGVAKRSTLVSYIPLALRTGNVEIRPNTFVTRILTEMSEEEGLHAVGVAFRDTWTGKTGEYRANIVIMAAGGIETPRLWLNSGLPENEWVGKGLTNHWIDCVTGIFQENDLMDILGVSDVKPYVGQNSAARLDYPGLGAMEPFGFGPGLFSSTVYGTSALGYQSVNHAVQQAAWDYEGLITGDLLKIFMKDYTRTLSILIFIDDEVNQRNGVTVDVNIQDENGSIPVIQYYKNDRDIQKRDQLAAISADILRKAGAKVIIRANYPPEFFVHIMSTMRMGYVTDTNCEALQVKRLFLADNSVLYNGLGGPNPTLTTQALATRTSEKLNNKYFK